MDFSKRELTIIISTYIVTHLLLIIVTGTWWDDWCFVGINNDILYDWFFLPMGRPDLIWTLYFPREWYRVFTFIAFGISVFCWDYVLKYWLKINKKHRFWICLLFATIPFFDARMIWAVFPYTVGFFIFSLACACFVYILYVKREFKVRYVVPNLLLFLCSFTLNSCLVYYAVILLMLYKYESSSLNVSRYKIYILYLLLPICFFVFKSVYFTPYGDYQGYNAVTFISLLKSLIDTPLAVIFVITDVLGNYFRMGQSSWFTLSVIVFTAALISERKMIRAYFIDKNTIFDGDFEYEQAGDDYKRQLITIVKYGFMLLFLGLFAYVVIRHRYRIDTVGIEGRDSVLIGIGASMLIYAIVRMLVREKVAPYILSFLIMCGGSFFFQSYQEYQLNYYKQQAFQAMLRENKQALEDVKNIYVIDSNPDKYGFLSVYTLNANAELVFDKQDKLFFTSEKQRISSFTSEMQTLYHMKDYDASWKKIDVVLYYSFNMTSKELWKVKIEELQNKDKAMESISEKAKMILFTKDDPRYREILNKAGISDEYVASSSMGE